MPRLVALLAVAYVLWPADLVPDLLPVLGWLDDLGFAAMALGYVTSQAVKYEEAQAAPAGAEGIEVRPAR